MGYPKTKKAYFTVDQYLAIERSSEERHFYLDGEIYAMAGESGAHADISVNILGLLGNQLIGKNFRLRTKLTKVRSGPKPNTTGLYSYPDVVVICGDPEYLDDHQDVVINPAVIIEVLSPETEAFDRGEKFTRYQTWNPTLSDYLLVSQDRARIEHFIRQGNGTWTYQRYTELETTILISSIECQLNLAEVYERITFSES